MVKILKLAKWQMLICTIINILGFRATIMPGAFNNGIPQEILEHTQPLENNTVTGRTSHVQVQNILFNAVSLKNNC